MTQRKRARSRNAEPEGTQVPKKRPPVDRPLSWRGFLLAAAPLAVLVIYLLVIAPRQVPVSSDLKVPFPAATAFLEDVIGWCVKHRGYVLAIGAGLLLPGLALGNRYFTRLALAATLALGFTYMSISAPIDRLVHGVERSLEDAQGSRRVGR